MFDKVNMTITRPRRAAAGGRRARRRRRRSQAPLSSSSQVFPPRPGPTRLREAAAAAERGRKERRRDLFLPSPNGNSGWGGRKGGRSARRAEKKRTGRRRREELHLHCLLNECNKSGLCRGERSPPPPSSSVDRLFSSFGVVLTGGDDDQASLSLSLSLCMLGASSMDALEGRWKERNSLLGAQCFGHILLGLFSEHSTDHPCRPHFFFFF